MFQRSLTRLAYLILSLYAIIGLMVRPHGDDLWYMARLGFDGIHRPDALDFMRHIVQAWHGRYSTLVVHTTLAPFEPLLSMLYPALLIVALVVVLRGCLNAAGLSEHAWLAPVWVAAWLVTLPDPLTLFYTVNTSIVYITPIVVAGVAAWCVLRWDMRDRQGVRA